MADDPRAVRHEDGNASPCDAAGIGVRVNERHLRRGEQAGPRVPLRFRPVRFLNANDLPRKYLIENELPLKSRLKCGSLM